MKRKLKVMFFYAHWDGCYDLRDNLFDLCKANNMIFESVDCETKEGVFLSRWHNVKLCPYIVVLDHGQELKRGVAQEIIPCLFG